MEAVPNQDPVQGTLRKRQQRGMKGHRACEVVHVVVMEMNDQNGSAEAALITPMDGTPITWISDQRNSNGI